MLQWVITLAVLVVVVECGELGFKIGEQGESCNDVCGVNGGACEMADGWAGFSFAQFAALGVTCPDMPGDSANGGVWGNEFEPAFDVTTDECLGYIDIGSANGHPNQIGCGDADPNMRRVCSCSTPDPGYNTQTYAEPWFTKEDGTLSQLVGISLKSMPTSPVTIPITSSNPTEGAASVMELVFDPSNWDQMQTFSVVGVKDFIVDGNKTYTVAIGPPTADTGNPYNGLALPLSPMTIINIDTDKPGVTVTPTSGLETSEGGGEAEFTIVLDTIPNAGVTIPLSSNNTGEGTVMPTSVVFTPTNWNVPQVVTATGVDDNYEDDGDKMYRVITASPISSDGDYSSLEVDDVVIKNVNDDIANVIIEPECALVVREDGGKPYGDLDQSTFTVKLTSRPTSSVSFTISSSDTTEGNPDPTMITWERDEWDTPREVTLVPVADDEEDCDIAYDIELSNGISDDPLYGGLWKTEIRAITQDDDGYCIRVYPVCITTFEGLINPEFSGEQDIRVGLSKQPADGAVIRVPLISSDTTEGIPPVSELVFTSSNWTWTELDVIGLNDYFDDGDIEYTVTVGPAEATGDVNYANKMGLEVAAINMDDDQFGVVFLPGVVAITEDVGDTPTGTFGVVLTSEPYQPVTITIEAQNSSRLLDDTFPSRVKSSSLVLVFQPSEWNVSQPVEVTSLDNWYDDGDKDYMMVGKDSSMDDMYNTNDMVAYNAVKLKDNDTAGVVVQLDGADLPMSFETSEEYQNVSLIEVWLTAQPLAPVNVSFTGTDNRRREDIFWREVAIEPSFIIIQPDQWNVTHTATLTCIDDMLVDGDLDLQLVAASNSSDAMFAAYKTETWFKTLDNDTAGIAYTLAGPEFTNESGTTTTLEYQLLTEPHCKWEMPDGAVEVLLTSTNPTEGVPEPSMLYISSENWTTPSVVTVIGQDDWVADGEQTYNITATIIKTCKNPSDVYNGTEVTMEIINGDDDMPALLLNGTETTTSENGTAVDLTLQLGSEPDGDVLITVSSNDTTEGSVAMNMLRFTPADWNVSQFVQVTGVDDDLIDGTVQYSVVVTSMSSDTLYEGLTGSVVLSNLDNDVPGYTFNLVEVVTSEDGRTDTVAVSLGTKPAADVVVTDITTNDTSEATVGAVSLTFTPDNWKVPQEFTVSGVDDDIQDGDVLYAVVVGKPTTTDVNYKEATARIPGVNIDNDTPGIAIYPTEQLVTSESGQTAVFTAVLRTQPKAEVSFSVDVSDKTEGTVNVTTLLFTTGGWSTPQTILVSGVDDQIFDGDMDYTILFGEVVSSDPGYAGLPTHTVSALNKDNETSPCEAFTGTCLMRAGRCEMCCPSTCTECKEGCDPAADPCCLKDDAEQCSADVHAPCSIVKPCLQFGLVCEGTNCTVCCESYCLDKCAPYDGFCSSMACTACRPNECGKMNCTDPTNSANACCKPISPTAEECSQSVSSPCKLVSPCTAFGDGICKDETCNVCCKSTCDQCGGDKCTADPMDTECCDTAIAKEEKYCTASVDAPCIRNDKCAEWGGICEDEACNVCCDASCGVCGVGPPECTQGEIFKGGLLCGDGVQAPCIRGTPCTQYSGVCKDEECNVCCDASCGSCGGSVVCSASPVDDQCCDTEIAKTLVFCGPDVPAPCIRNDLCKPFGGICKDETCTVCCDPACGECGSLTCTTDPSALCCTDPILGSGVMCSATVGAPCIRELPNTACDVVGGICKDRDCNVCCHGTCPECGGDMCTANPMDEQCCDTAIAKKEEYCEPVGTDTAPCLRNPLCKEHGGICMNSTCEVCCKAECGECLAAPCTGECCVTDIVVANKTCGAAPCLRPIPPPFCEVYGGVCGDEACEVCCHGGCGVCGDGPHCTGDTDADSKCCPGTIKDVMEECVVSKTAPCVRVSKCSEYGGVCDDVNNCKICCNTKCGATCGVTNTCGTVLAEDQCCAGNITGAGVVCGEEGAVAPCVLPQDDSHDHLLYIILLIVGILLCCSCVALIVWLLMRKKKNTAEEDDDKNQNWFDMEEKRSDMHALLNAKADEENKPNPGETAAVEEPKPAATSPPARTAKKRGQRGGSASVLKPKSVGIDDI